MFACIALKTKIADDYDYDDEYYDRYNYVQSDDYKSNRKYGELKAGYGHDNDHHDGYGYGYHDDGHGYHNDGYHDDHGGGHGYRGYHDDGYGYHDVGYHNDGYGNYGDHGGGYGYHHHGYKPKKKKVYVPVFVPAKEKKKSNYIQALLTPFEECSYNSSHLT